MSLSFWELVVERFNSIQHGREIILLWGEGLHLGSTDTSPGSPFCLENMSGTDVPWTCTARTGHACGVSVFIYLFF